MKRICHDCLRDVVPLKPEISPSYPWECPYCGIAYTEWFFIAANKQGYFVREKDGKIIYF